MSQHDIVSHLRVLLHDVEIASWGPGRWHARRRLAEAVERYGDELLYEAMRGLTRQDRLEDVGRRRLEALARWNAKRRQRRAEAREARRLERIRAAYARGEPITLADWDAIHGIRPAYVPVRNPITEAA